MRIFAGALLLLSISAQSANADTQHSSPTPSATALPEPAAAPTAQATPVAPVAGAIPVPMTQQTAVLEPTPVQNVLRSGTEVPLNIREELTTEKKNLRVGQRFQMEVAAPIELNGIVVIPAGTPAIGEITDVRNKGMWGKSGYISARAVSLRLGDRSIRLTGTFDDKGVTGTAGVVGAVVFVPIAGFFMTGTSAKIPMGSGTKAFLDEDLTFRTVPVQSQVIDITVVTPQATTSTPTVTTPH
jgi:hypothetical protein